MRAAEGFDGVGVERGEHHKVVEGRAMNDELGGADGAFVRCASHWFEPSVGECKDCRDHICADCIVDVRGIGTFCRPCALIRAGVRAKTAVS